MDSNSNSNSNRRLPTRVPTSPQCIDYILEFHRDSPESPPTWRPTRVWARVGTTGGETIPETPANRVPSCSGCHRAGKDCHEDIVEWHRMRSGSKNHPRNVLTHAEWERAHEKVKQFDRFNRAHAREISGGSAYDANIS